MVICIKIKRHWCLQVKRNGIETFFYRNNLVLWNMTINIQIMSHRNEHDAKKDGHLTPMLPEDRASLGLSSIQGSLERICRRRANKVLKQLHAKFLNRHQAWITSFEPYTEWKCCWWGYIGDENFVLDLVFGQAKLPLKHVNISQLTATISCLLSKLDWQVMTWPRSEKNEIIQTLHQHSAIWASDFH